MIDPVWKKQYNVATLKILNLMTEMEDKWRQKYGNNNPVQIEERRHAEQSGDTSGNTQSQPRTEQVISGGGNQYPSGNGG